MSVQTLIAHAPETLQIEEDVNKCLPLHMLCRFCDCDDFFEIVKAMVEAYPDRVTKKIRGGQLPIHQVCDCSNSISDLGRKLPILDFLIEKYPDSILVKDWDNVNPSQVVRLSIEYYLKKNQNEVINKNEYMFLLHQVMAGEFSHNIGTFMLNTFPESCNLQDDNGMTPLHA